VTDDQNAFIEEQETIAGFTSAFDGMAAIHLST
jgi:hypothetical protein